MLTHKENNMMCIILDYVDIMVTLYIILSIALNDVMSSYSVILCYIKYIAFYYVMFCIMLFIAFEIMWSDDIVFCLLQRLILNLTRLCMFINLHM